MNFRHREYDPMMYWMDLILLIGLSIGVIGSTSMLLDGALVLNTLNSAIAFLSIAIWWKITFDMIDDSRGARILWKSIAVFATVLFVMYALGSRSGFIAYMQQLINLYLVTTSFMFERALRKQWKNQYKQPA